VEKHALEPVGIAPAKRTLDLVEEETKMKKKLLMLLLALASVMGARMALATTEDEPCNFEVCCPSRGCFCCDEPCAIRCEP
jgi:hypothetical protein